MTRTANGISDISPVSGSFRIKINISYFIHNFSILRLQAKLLGIKFLRGKWTRLNWNMSWSNSVTRTGRLGKMDSACYAMQDTIMKSTIFAKHERDIWATTIQETWTLLRINYYSQMSVLQSGITSLQASSFKFDSYCPKLTKIDGQPRNTYIVSFSIAK